MSPPTLLPAGSVVPPTDAGAAVSSLHRRTLHEAVHRGPGAYTQVQTAPVVIFVFVVKLSKSSTTVVSVFIFVF